MKSYHVMERPQAIAAAVALLVALRFAAAAILPLSFDEAYYWLWSKHLALSYYDHPPLIAYAIRLGTMLFGDSAFSVRFVPLLFSAGASWAVWRTGAILLESEKAGALASLFFNLTLMTTVETMTATPDAPLMFAAALFVWTLAKLEESGDARLWLAAGAAGGLALLSKYTALFLGAGTLAWLVFTREGRRWIATPWPWLGALIAILMFMPVIWWNAQHDWISFRFQFGKAGEGHFAPSHLAEFLAGQLALASPFLFTLGVIGLVRPGGKKLVLLSALAAPSALFFTEHAMHARIEGNWPSFLYPALAIAAAGAALSPAAQIWIARVTRISKRLAVPVAVLFLAGAYAQALTGFLPVRDPTARLLASGSVPVAQRIEALRVQYDAAAILTTNYAPTGWLAFYVPDHPPVVQANEAYRWLAAPKADAGLLHQPLLYVTEPRRDEARILAYDFARQQLVARLTRTRNGRAIDLYDVYLVSGWRGAPLGRVTNRP